MGVPTPRLIIAGLEEVFLKSENSDLLQTKSGTRYLIPFRF